MDSSDIGVLRLQLARVRGGVLGVSEPHIAGTAITHARDYVHGLNRRAGWWTNLRTGLPKDRNHGELLMLCVSELAEVPTERHVYDTLDDHLPERLMGEVELADCLIRVLDLCGGLNLRLGEALLRLLEGKNKPVPNRRVDIGLMGLVRHFAQAMEGDRKNLMVPPGEEFEGFSVFEASMARATYELFMFSEMMAWDIVSALCEKIMYNQVRRDHKIETRMGENGKAY